MSSFKFLEVIMNKSPLGKQDKNMLGFQQEDVKLDYFLPFLNL